MHQYRDTNPHFGTPNQSQEQEQDPHSPPPPVALEPIQQQQQQHGQHSSNLPLPHYGHNSGPPPLSPERYKPRQPILHRQPRVKHQGRQSLPLGPLIPISHDDQETHSRPKKQSRLSQPRTPPISVAPVPQHDQDQQHPPTKHEGHDSLPLVTSAAPIPRYGQDQQHHTPQHHTPHRSQQHPHGSNGLLMPVPQQTNFFTWSAAFCCAIFWVLIILTGLIVLIVYLVFRPRTPKFHISTATLNTAYLDMGYLLNADLTVLVNFTNPNKKVSVYFSPMYIDAYYGSTLIATTYIEPFTARKHESMFANVHMVASQVRLGLLESQRLKKQLATSRAGFEIKGYFRAHAKFGSLLRYSYKLHGDCTVVFSRPPNGVVVGGKCKTRH